MTLRSATADVKMMLNFTFHELKSKCFIGVRIGIKGMLNYLIRRLRWVSKHS